MLGVLKLSSLIFHLIFHQDTCECLFPFRKAHQIWIFASKEGLNLRRINVKCLYVLLFFLNRVHAKLMIICQASVTYQSWGLLILSMLASHHISRSATARRHHIKIACKGSRSRRSLNKGFIESCGRLTTI